MPKTNFDLPDGEEVGIDPSKVVDIFVGDVEGETIIELEDGSEVTVAATKIEVIAELSLNPLNYLDPDEEEGFRDYSEEVEGN